MSRGPEEVVPARCTTIELKDLADTDNFDLLAEVGTIYGFEYTDTGFYKRIEIEDKKVLKLEQLRNVEAAIVENSNYKIQRIGSKWHLTPIVEWDLKYEFISPYTMIDKQKKFRKALNAGPFHCSIIPDHDSRAIIDVHRHKKSFRLHSSRGQVVSGIIFVPDIDFGDNYTLIITLFVPDDNLDRSGKNNIVLIPGIQINWRNLSKAEQEITVVVKKEDDNIKHTPNNEKVSTALSAKKLTGLSAMELTHFDLVSLYYIENPS